MSLVECVYEITSRRSDSDSRNAKDIGHEHCDKASAKWVFSGKIKSISYVKWTSKAKMLSKSIQRTINSVTELNNASHVP